MTQEEEMAIEALAALPGVGDVADDGFSALVLRKIQQRRKRKALMLGAAGSAGSAIAGAQLTAMVGAMPAILSGSVVPPPPLSGVTVTALRILTTAPSGLVTVKPQVAGALASMVMLASSVLASCTVTELVVAPPLRHSATVAPSSMPAPLMVMSTVLPATTLLGVTDARLSRSPPPPPPPLSGEHASSLETVPLSVTV